MVTGSREAIIARRRTLTGQPLLLASSVALTVGVGCGKGKTAPEFEPVGNLMAPPMEISSELCVEVQPEGALVKINGEVAEAGCAVVQGREGSEVRVEITAAGRPPIVRELQLSEQMAPLRIEMSPPRPVGNLMAPPLPPQPK